MCQQSKVRLSRDALENIACISQLYTNFNILWWFPPLSVSWSPLSTYQRMRSGFPLTLYLSKHTRRRDSNPGLRSSDKLTNKPVIDHVPLLWVTQTSKRATQAKSDKKRTIKAKHDSSSSPYCPPPSLSLSLSHALLYLSHPPFPSLRLLLCPLFMNSPCLARRPTEKFLVCSLSQGQSLVRKPIELWSNSSP